MENSGHSYGDPGFGLADLDDSTPRPCAARPAPASSASTTDVIIWLE